MPSEGIRFLKVALDLVIVAAVGFPILILHMKGVPFQRGFFCDDDSILYPYKDSTVSSVTLYLVGILVPSFVICLNELYEETINKHDEQVSRSRVLCGRTLPAVLWRLYKQIGVFIFGACLSQLTTDIAKYSIGRLRPHFIAVCKPTFDCTTAKKQHFYVQDYSCRGSDIDQIREARLSFPSGHSSFSAYTMVYLVLYLHTCTCLKANKLMKPFLQFVLITMSWYTALSRISDYKHHWSDVLVGCILGSVTAIVVARFVSDMFPSSSSKQLGDDALQIEFGRATNTNYNAIDLEQQ